MTSEIKILLLKAKAIEPFIQAISELRILVFKEFPYLYDGDMNYEARYLKHYAEHDSARCVLALHNDQVVGASTAMALTDAAPEFQACFQKHSELDIQKLFYFGESVLLPEFRNRGIGHRFFDEREAQAKAFGANYSAFCAVERPNNHPLRPSGYTELNAFWLKRSYVKKPELKTHFSWKEVGDEHESEHPMVFWLKPLNNDHAD